MSETNNPFHQWLGLKPSLKKPHHFQLLGVSPQLVDDAEIKEAVAAGVSRNLALLARAPSNASTAPVIAKLKEQIAIAEKTLTDPKLRAIYKAKLKTKIEASKNPKAHRKAKEDSNPTAKDRSGHPKASELLPPSTMPTRPADAAPVQSQRAPQTETGGLPPNAPNNASASPAPAIPLAVPLSPDQVESLATAKSAGVMQATPLAINAEADSLGAQDDRTAGLSNVKINKKFKRRKRSNLAPLVMFVMIIAGGVGVWFTIANLDSLKKLGQAPAEKKPAKKTETPEKLNPVDPDSLADLDETKIFETPKMVPKKVDPTPKEPETEIESNKPQEVVEKGPLTFDELQLARFRRDLQRGHRCLFRRDHELAGTLFSRADDIAREVSLEEDRQFVPSQQTLIQNISDSREVMKLIKGFWEQVHASAEGIQGAQEIIVGSQIVGFVESKPNSVILRRSGVNTEYGYSFCPPGLALALAEQVAVPDVPIWNMQKAAFFAVDQMFGVNHQSKIDTFLEIAEEAGRDCSAIRRFCEFSFGSLGQPQQKIEPLDKRTVDQVLKEFRNESGYTNARKLKPEKALTLCQDIMLITSPNFEQHVAILDEAIALGIRGGNANITEDAIIEMSYFTNIKRGDLTCDSFAKLAMEKLTAKQTRDLMERSIGFLNSPTSNNVPMKTKQTLIKRLLKLSEKSGMPDAFRRLNQISN